MKLQKKVWALGIAAALLAALIGFLMPSANATTNPPWEPDTQALGTITFYNASGQVVTSGTDLTNLFTYAAAGTPTNRAGTTKAFLSYAFPDHNKTTGQWFATAASLATFYPVTDPSAPANIKAITNPIVTTTGTGAANLTGVFGQGTFDPTAGYNNTLQVRLGDSGGGFQQDSSHYWDADILVNQTTGSWQQVYPAPASGPTATTTTLSASPSGTAAHGTSVTFTATLSPTGATGSVIFSDNGTAISPAITVSGGHAAFTTSTLAVGSHPITASFTPTDATAYGASSSTALSYTITSSAVTTTTSFGVTPTSPITAGTASTLTANVSPPTAVGSVQFYDGTTAIGSPVTLTSGTATLAHSFAAGSYSLKATFTPTDSTAFTSSTSSVTSYQVNAPATPTTTTLGITPGSPQVFGTSLTFTATISPSAAAGTVNFLDNGTTVIGGSAITVAGGTAALTTASLGAGSHSITAQFVPASAATYETSTSAATSYTITKAASTVSIAASPTGSALQGSNVTLTATVGPTGVGGGAVQFSYTDGTGPHTVGAPATVTGTTATLVTSALPVGTTGVSAVFTPASGNYGASPSSGIDYTITLPPPTVTTTGLTVTPASPVNVGTTETLKATVTPASAAGTIQFFDGSTMIGSPVTVTSGTATFSTTLGLGAHTLMADFLASDTTKFDDSDSTGVPYQVLPPATATTTTVAVAPGSSEPYGTAVAVTATVSPAAAGTVQFKDGTTVLGSSAVTVGASSGTAMFTTTALHGGEHTITAAFTPSSPVNFAPSSGTGSVTITAVATTTSVSINPVGPVSQGASVKLTAVVSPSAAAGSIAFHDGSTLLGTAPLVSGVATLTTKALPIGADSITATFTATHTGDFASSTSEPATISVLTPPSIASVFANGKLLQPGGSTVAGATLQIHAEGFQPNETVTVDVHSTTVKIGTVLASANGFATVTVTLPTSLATGAHTLSMVGSLGTATFNFVVTKASSSGGGSTSGGGSGNLAGTGVDSEVGIIAGLLLLTAGLMLIGAARRRGGVRG